MARTYQIITLFTRDTILRNAMLALLGLSPLRWNPWLPLNRQQHCSRARIGAGAGRARSSGRAAARGNLLWRETASGDRHGAGAAAAHALLDEPFAGLSIDERRDVRELLKAIPRDVTVVMIEHDMDIALDLADRITLLHFGEVIVEGTRAEVVADPRTREVYLGE